jgi:hypothetical protein
MRAQLRVERRTLLLKEFIGVWRRFAPCFLVDRRFGRIARVQLATLKDPEYSVVL